MKLGILLPANRWKRFVLVCFTLLVGIPVLGIGLSVGALAYHFNGTAELPAECAIVFGAAVYGQDKPGPALTRRTAEAATLYRDGQLERLIMSGGKGRGVATSEAEVMQELAIHLGVQKEDILLEDQARSTWENVAYAQNLTKECESVVAVSDAYHLARIALIARRQGWALPTVAATARPTPLSERRSMVRELLGLLYYGFYLDTVYPQVSAASIENVLNGIGRYLPIEIARTSS